jgi:hypothetical protein
MNDNYKQILTSEPRLNSLRKDCYYYFMYQYILHTRTENNRVYLVVSLGMGKDGNDLKRIRKHQINQ